MGIEQWSTTSGDNVNSKTGINWDEGQAPSTVNDSARSTMAAVREWYEDAEWIKLGENGSANSYSISYVSASVFKFAGTDRRTIVPVGRRVKAGVGAGTVYGSVTDSSLSASDTQVTVSWDSGNLDASLSYVSLGILSPTNTAIPSASQAQMESATSTSIPVTPGIQHYHPGMPKLVVQLSNLGGSPPTASAVFNALGALTPARNADGDHTLTWTNTLNNPRAIVSSESNATTIPRCTSFRSGGVTTTSVRILTSAFDGTLLNPNTIFIVVYGDL